MALPSSGPLTLNDIQTEFGGSNPISLSEYYAGGAYVPSGTTGTYGAVPSSGTIGIRNFYGTQKLVMRYKGTIGFRTSANSWYQSALNSNACATVYSGSSTTGVVGIWSNFGSTGSSTGTRRGGVAIFDMATNSYTNAYSFNTPGAPFYPYFPMGDMWGNVWGLVSSSVANNNRIVRLSPSNDYATIQNEWLANANNNSTFPQVTRPGFVNNSVHPTVNYIASNGYFLGVTSTGTITTYNACPAMVSTSFAMVNAVSNTPTLNNEIFNLICPNTATSSISGIGTYDALINRFDGNMNLLGQSSINWNGLASIGGFQIYRVSAGPITNLLLIRGTGRFGGTTTSFQRAFYVWLNLGSAGSIPTVVSATIASSSTETQNLAQPPALVAVKDGYEYWGCWFEVYPSPASYVFKVNSSGIIVEGWINSGTVTSYTQPLCMDTNGTMALFQGSSSLGMYNGVADITRFLNNQYSGWGFASNSTYNGVALTSINGFSVTMNPIISAFSSPLINPCVNTATPPSVSSGQATTAQSASAMMGPVING